MIYISDAQSRTDSAYHTLVRHIDSPIPIVMVSWDGGFVFNEELHSIKDFVLIDFNEYGYDWPLEESGTHIWGVNSEKFPRYYTEEWKKFDDWVKQNPPVLTFKRELLKGDHSDEIYPIEYPCIVGEYPIQSKEEFNARPIELLNYWGRSNEHRLRVHGEIWQHAFEKGGINVCDNIYYTNLFLANEEPRRWFTMNIPHFARVDVGQLMNINFNSKLCLSLPGAGNKCFRSAEAPANSIMVMYKNNLSWAYSWDESNCILIEPGKEIEGIEAALQRDDLYDIYLKGIENCNKYRVENYISNYIQPLIQSVV